MASRLSNIYLCVLCLASYQKLLVTRETLESCSFLDWANNRDLNDIIDDGIDHERLQEEIGWKYDGAGVWTRDRDAKP